MMMWKSLIFAFLLVGVFAEEYKIPEDRKAQIKTFMAAQCKKAGAEDKVDEVTNAAQVFVDCLKELINPAALKQEIEDAKPNGALDEVFKKYCAKTPQLKTCIHNLLDGVSPCIDAESRDQITSAKNGTDQLIDFVCYKDGDRIALFIAEQGPECLTDKANALRDCAMKVKDSVPDNVEAVKALTITDKCHKFDELSTCITTALDQCNTPTPGNMASSLLRYVRKGSPCKDVAVKTPN